jgi:hypothetical protein
MTMRQTGAPDDPAAQAICRTPDWDLVSGLPWVRFDTSMPDNPKILELVSMREGRAAAFVYCCGLAYSGKHGTDGFLPAAALACLARRDGDAPAMRKHHASASRVCSARRQCAGRCDASMHVRTNVLTYADLGGYVR